MTIPDPNYQANLSATLWDYRDRAFGDTPQLFDQATPSGARPPVFVPEAANHNVLSPPNTRPEVVAAIRGAVEPTDRHRWFRSMKSSQALAQSIFAGLSATGALDTLGGLEDDDGLEVFPMSGPGHMQLERNVTYLGEPRPTSVDAWFDGEKRVAVECKLREPDVGRCSRPELRPKDRSYAKQYCDGTYSAQRGRTTRCSLTEIGVKYWDFIPQILDWDASTDLRPCPLAATYQLVRNVLAATVRQDGSAVDHEKGFALLMYDARNPANSPAGAVGMAFKAVRSALREPSVLRRCSWQRLVGHLVTRSAAPWLTAALADKYGITADHTS